MRAKGSISPGSLVILGFVFGIILIVSINLLADTVYKPPKIRTEKAWLSTKEYVGDQWNVTFLALDGNYYMVEDYAANGEATYYELKFSTNGTFEFFDDVIIEITQVTDLAKSEYLKPKKIK